MPNDPHPTSPAVRTPTPWHQNTAKPNRIQNEELFIADCRNPDYAVLIIEAINTHQSLLAQRDTAIYKIRYLDNKIDEYQQAIKEVADERDALRKELGEAVEALKYIADRGNIANSDTLSSWKWINEFVEVANRVLLARHRTTGEADD